jgi:hypothetical protein
LATGFTRVALTNRIKRTSPKDLRDNGGTKIPARACASNIEARPARPHNIMPDMKSGTRPANDQPA